MWRYNVQKTPTTLQEAEKDKSFHVYVFGLPRSGTSCMTHICELLGVKMFHTSEEKKHEYPSLGEYHPNPTGFYEITQNTFSNYVDMIGTSYSGCKMIVPVNGFRWDVVCSSPAKIIFMVRDPKEIKHSQEAFYSRESDVAFIRTALVSQAVALRKAGIPFLEVNYRDLATNTKETVERVKAFLNSDAPIEPCVDFVKPDLYRHRKEVLV